MKKNKLLALVGAAALVAALTQTVHAIPITGNIGFSGAAQLDDDSVQAATKTVAWINTVVNGGSGSFAVVPINSPVVLMSPWSFTSGVINNFWTVGGFTFNLVSSSIHSQDSLFLNVVLVGTVTALNYDPSVFSGTFQVANPSANGQAIFTQRLSFSAVPDGGTTWILLGLSLVGIALIKRKMQNRPNSGGVMLA